LILVHRREIFNQWVERISNFLQIPKKDIVQFASTKKSLKLPITIAMIQTLNKMENLEDLSSTFCLILVDECHHIPAQMFRQVIAQFNSYFLYGLTATPKWKRNDEKLIFTSEISFMKYRETIT
jgi:superfamily II DNA or RNA helicase